MNYSNYTLATSNLLRRVYAWMTAGLVITGAVAYLTWSTNLVEPLLRNPLLLFLLIGLQLGCVIFLAARITSMDFATAALVFLLYSALTGLTLSSIFVIYTHTSIFTTFLVCAGTFAATASYGYFTKADLSSMGSFLLMALFGLIIAGVVNLFMRSTQLQLIISAFGVLIFTLLTAYDVQKIKRMGYELEARGLEANNIAIRGALTLYLDALNLFLYLLQFLGTKKDHN